MKYPRLVAGAAFVLTFLAGALVTHVVDAHRVAAGAAHPDAWSDAVRRLQLSAEQERNVERVFEKYQPSTDAIMTAMVPRLTAVADSMQRDIEAILTPDQRAGLQGLQRPIFVIRRRTTSGTRVDTLQTGEPR